MSQAVTWMNDSGQYSGQVSTWVILPYHCHTGYWKMRIFNSIVTVFMSHRWQRCRTDMRWEWPWSPWVGTMVTCSWPCQGNTQVTDTPSVNLHLSNFSGRATVIKRSQTYFLSLLLSSVTCNYYQQAVKNAWDCIVNVIPK